MGFIVDDRRPGECTGIIGPAGTGEAVETWEIIADSNNYSTEDLRNAGLFPAVYTSYHPQNPLLRFHPVQITQDAESPSRFVCLLRWSSDKLTPQQEEELDQEENPLDRKARIKLGTGKAKEVNHTDRLGKPKTNKAGDLFDNPPESTVTYRIIKIKKNVTVFPDWVFDFDDCVNSEPFTIKGRTIPAKCAWIAAIDLGDERTDGPEPYCEAYIEIHVKRRRGPSFWETFQEREPPYPWQTEIMNDGFNELVEVDPPETPARYIKKRIKVADSDDGNKLINSPNPIPLTTAGVALAPLTPETIDRVNFVIFDDHDYKDFNEISYLWSDA